MDRAGASKSGGSGRQWSDPTEQPGLEVHSTEQPGLEVAPRGQDGLQVDQPEKEALYAGDDTPKEEIAGSSEGPNKGLIRSDPPPNWQQGDVGKRSFWRSKKGFICIATAVVVVLGVALGAGLGAGLSSSPGDASTPRNKGATSDSDADDNASSQPEPEEAELKVGGALDPAYYSTGASWNGSAIGQQWQYEPNSWGGQGGNLFTIYYQHAIGDIRWVQYNSSRGVNRPDSEELEIVTTDARNSTPIAATARREGDVGIFDVFYIDTQNLVRQRTRDSSSASWSDGDLNLFDLRAHDSDTVGLAACYGGAETWPTRLWYASSATSVEEYAYNDNTWEFQKTWSGYHGTAGIGCRAAEGAAESYAAFVNTDDALELWYQDSTEELDPERWHQTDVTLPKLYPATSIALSKDLLAAQRQDASLVMAIPTLEAQDTKLGSTDAFALDENVDLLLGTRLAATAFPGAGDDNGDDDDDDDDEEDGTLVLLFAQTGQEELGGGVEVVEFRRDFAEVRDGWHGRGLLEASWGEEG